MSNRDYVVNIGENEKSQHNGHSLDDFHNDKKIIGENSSGQNAIATSHRTIEGDLPPYHSRRNSLSSQQSSGSCTSPNYDSGNFSCSNTSDISIRPPSYSSAEDDGDFSVSIENNPLGCGLPTSSNNGRDDSKNFREIQRILKEKEQALGLALKESKKHKSELDRLIKSERWYKNELKNQKRSRLDLLEKLYLNEKRFIEENRQLKADCTRLYSVCEEIEKKALTEKDSLARQLKGLQELLDSTKTSSEDKSGSNKYVEQLKFELQKEKEIIEENNNLIEVLRKQKQGLLDDIRKLNSERDSKILVLEARKLALEEENKKSTKDIQRLNKENEKLKNEIENCNETIQKTRASLRWRDSQLSQFRIGFKEQEDELVQRRKEIENLKINIKKLEAHNAVENVELIGKYKTDLSNRLSEIENLKATLIAKETKIIELRKDVEDLSSLRIKLESIQSEFLELQEYIKGKESEIENLESLKHVQSEQIDNLRGQLNEYEKLRVNFDKYVNLLQQNTKTLEIKNEELEEVLRKNVTLTNENISLKSEMRNYQENLEETETILNKTNSEIEELHVTNSKQQEEITKLKENLQNFFEIDEEFSRRQSVLENNKVQLKIKEKEIEDLKALIRVQSNEIDDLNEKVEENSKLREKIDELSKFLENYEITNNNLNEEILRQNENVKKLKCYQEKTEKLEKMFKKQEEITRAYSLDVETLQLVVRGQNAQFQRINNRENEENMELREKLTELSKLLEESQNEQKTTSNELKCLKVLAKQQAEEIVQLTKNNQINEIEKLESSIGNELSKSASFPPDSDLELKLKKIEMLRTLVNEKSDNVQRLNEEHGKWIQLLDGLTKSRKTPEKKPSLSAGLDKDAEVIVNSDDNVNCTTELSNENNSNLIDSEFESTENDSLLYENSTKEDDETLENNNDHPFDPELKLQVEPLQKKTEEFSELSKCYENQKEEIISLKNRLSLLRLKHEKEESNLKEEIKNLSLELNNIKNDYQAFQDYITKPDKVMEISNNSDESKEHDENLNKCAECDLTSQENEALQAIINKLREIIRSPTTSSSSSSSSELPPIINHEDWKILQKVMENEHNKRISRYEIHIRSLLNSLKSYKRNLLIAEKRFSNLSEICRELEEKLLVKENELDYLKEEQNEFLLHNYLSNSCEHCCSKHQNKFELQPELKHNIENLRDISKKYEHNQQVVSILRHQLESTRKQFMEMDDYKRLSLDLKDNLKPLMEEYRNVMPCCNYKSPQKSFDLNYIYDLIKRSDNFVPNYKCLTDVLDALKDDIRNTKNCSKTDCQKNSDKRKYQKDDENDKKSLMAELKEANLINLPNM